MALKLRQSSASRVKLLSTFIAVFALLVQPMYGFVESRVANAAQSHEAFVYNEADLQAAASNTAITVIHIRDNITLNNKIVLSGRDVNVKGGGKTLTFNGQSGWKREYVIQAYKNYITLGSITITGGDAAVLANGAKVRLLGNVNVSNNEFGGIELSKGENVTKEPILHMESGAKLVNGSEKLGEPTVWVDKASEVSAVFQGTEGVFSRATHVKTNQDQYYLNPANTGTVATNIKKQKTYSSVEVAIDEATEGDEIRLEKDVTLGSPTIRIRKSVTLDGNGKTVSTTAVVPSPRSSANGVYNAAFIVLASDVELKNMIIDGEATNGTAHGVVVDQGLSGVKLTDITTKNGAAGVIINASSVAVKNITTSNNGWYGINVDGRYGLATLLIGGTNSHADGGKSAIFSEDKTKVVITDENSQYAQVLPVHKSPVAYVLHQELPVVKLNVPKIVGDTSKISATADAKNGRVIKKQWFEIINVETGKAYYWYDFNRDAIVDTVEFKIADAKSSVGEKISLVNGAEYSVRYVTTDSAGLKSDSVNATIEKFVVDTESPEVDVQVQGAVNGFARGVVTIVGTVNDKNPDNSYMTITGPNKYVVKSDGKAKEWKEHSYVWNTAGLRGEYTIEFQARDKADNKTNRSVKKIRVTVDNDLPAEPTIVAQNVTDNVIKGNQQFLVTAEQYATLNVKSDHGVLTPGANGIYTLDTSAIPYGTKVTITAQATDEAGNESPVTSLTYTVQNDGPAISNVKVSSDRPSFSQTVTGSVLPAAGAKVTVIANDKMYPAIVNTVTGMWSVVIDVTGYNAGRYDFSVIAEDQYQNTTRSTARYSFNVTSPVTSRIDRQDSFGPVANPARIFGVSNVAAAPVLAADEDVLGARDTKTASPEKTVAVIEPSTQGWKLFGLAWFWWVLLGAAIAAGWWMIAAARRRRDENAY